MSQDLLRELQSYIEEQYEQLHKCTCHPMTIADLKKYEAIHKKLSSQIVDLSLKRFKQVEAINIECNHISYITDNTKLINQSEDINNGETSSTTSFATNIVQNVKRVRKKSKIVVENEKQAKEKEDELKKRKTRREKKKQLKQELKEEEELLNEIKQNQDEWIELKNESDDSFSHGENIFEVVTESNTNEGLKNVRRFVQRKEDDSRFVHNPLSAVVSTNTSRRKRQIKCKECGVSLLNMQKLLNHICYDNANSQHSFRCLDCEEVFEDEMKMKNHKCPNELLEVMDDVDVDSMYNAKCEDKRMQENRIVLKSNLRELESPFKCSYCGHVFRSRAYLLMHSCVHGNRKYQNEDSDLFRCEYCKRIFLTPQTLRCHMRMHTGAKPYHCQLCNARFNQRTSLRNHGRTHTGEKPFECDYCGMHFAQKITMTQHRRIHTGEKPFQCSICHVNFSLRLTLKRHLLKHTGEKPYNCDYCDATFTRKYSMTVHERNHEISPSKMSSAISSKHRRNQLIRHGLNGGKNALIHRRDIFAVARNTRKPIKQAVSLLVQKTEDGICVFENKDHSGPQEEADHGLNDQVSIQSSTKIEHVLNEVLPD